jgi:hypothetical protein
MNLSRLIKRNQFYILCLLIALLATSCSRAAEPESILVQIPATDATPEPVVAYGSSLSEWEEATQADLEQIENNNGVNTELEQPLELAPTATLPAPIVVEVNTATSTETDTNSASASTAPSSGETDADSIFILDGVSYQEVLWDALVPADFTAEAIMAKYESQLAQISDGSQEGADLYAQMQAEFDNAPINDKMDGARIRLAGFIAPLEYTDDLITEFLLAPYYGACIHVPPPPANQTILVKLSEGQGIKFEDIWVPFWVMGELTAEGVTTELAQAGYYMENAFFERYSDDR